MQELLGLPLSASAHASKLDHSLGIIHWLMLVLFVVWGVFYMYSLIRFRKSKNVKANYVGLKTTIPFYLVGAVAVFELAMLLGVDMPVWKDWVSGFPSEKDAVVVDVVAEQFAWNIHYSGKDGIFGRRDLSLISEDNPLGLDRTDPNARDDITTVNQLHLPANKSVIINLSSKDVIHSFFLPVMRVKQDVVPGVKNRVWFVPTLANDDSLPNYEIACAQLCGLAHYRMRGYLTIDTPEKYDAWMAEQVAQLPRDSTAAVQ